MACQHVGEAGTRTVALFLVLAWRRLRTWPPFDFGPRNTSRQVIPTFLGPHSLRHARLMQVPVDALSTFFLVLRLDRRRQRLCSLPAMLCQTLRGYSRPGHPAKPPTPAK